MSSTQQQTLTPNGNISTTSASTAAATLTSAAVNKQPPTWFDLSEIDPNQALIDMRHFTHNFEGMHDVDFRERLDNSINRHFGRVNKPVIIGYIPAPPKTNANNIDVVKKIIGLNGYWLKKTTENCGVHFIWYDSKLNNFLFWAPNRFTISKAMNAIRWRLIKYFEFTFTRKTPVSDAIYYQDGFGDGCDELPPLIPCNELTPPPRDVLTAPPPILNKRRWETYGRKFSDYNPADDTPNSLEEEEDENYDNYGQRRIQTGSVPLARRLCVSPSPPPIPPPPPPSSSSRRRS